MKTEQIKRAVLIATFAAIVFAGGCVALPAGIGNINLADSMLLFCAMLMGPIPALIAGIIGATLGDLAAGYAIYIPATLLIKAGMALLLWLMWRLLKDLHDMLRFVIGGVVAELFMVAGYFVYESTLLGLGLGAAANIPANLLQGAIAIGLSVGVYSVFKKTNLTRQFEAPKLPDGYTAIVLEEDPPEDAKQSK